MRLRWRALRLAPILLALLAAACAAPVAPDASRAPRAEVDLNALVFEDGDLPASINAERGERPAWLATVPAATAEVSRRLVSAGVERGSVTLWLYPAGSDLDTTYEPLSAVLQNAAQRPPQYVGTIGDRSGIITSSLPKQPLVYDLTFTRCAASVYLRLQTTNVDDVLQYARRLDGRIQQRLC